MVGFVFMGNSKEGEFIQEVAYKFIKDFDSDSFPNKFLGLEYDYELLGSLFFNLKLFLIKEK